MESRESDVHGISRKRRAWNLAGSAWNLAKATCAGTLALLAAAKLLTSRALLLAAAKLLTMCSPDTTLFHQIAICFWLNVAAPDIPGMTFALLRCHPGHAFKSALSFH